VKRVSTGVLAALIVTLCGLNAVAAPSTATHGNTGNSVAQMGAAPPADFGSPPSGQIPILYNDHHVYSKPDVLKQGRVLAALVKGGELLIPLRSMFEQMGATVSWDAGSKTATVSKPGAEVKVTVGKPEVVINGESRPLDVPPMIYQGVVLVPVRVISEGMGAYVQWVPDRHIVVVRYIPATPPPSPAPPPATAPPPPPPPPPPTPRPLLGEAFVAGDYIFSPTVYNEFNPGNRANGGNGGYAVRGGGEFSLGSIPFMLEGAYEHWPFPHNCTVVGGVNQPDCYVTNIGGGGSSPVTTTTTLYDQNVDARFAVRVLQPRVYIGVGYIWLANNYGYPNLSGVGFGGEKLPDLNHVFSFFGSVWYYPSVNGTAQFSIENPYPSNGFTTHSLPLQYNILKYQAGLTIGVGNTPLFVEAGWMGDSWSNKENAPINRSYNGPFAGLGFRFLYP
jgi:hypothetical protein